MLKLHTNVLRPRRLTEARKKFHKYTLLPVISFCGKGKTPVVNSALSQLCVCRAVLISVSRHRTGREPQLCYMYCRYLPGNEAGTILYCLATDTHGGANLRRMDLTRNAYAYSLNRL